MGKPIVYLDMDGVLADFFSEYAKMAGVKGYRDIPADKVNPTLDAMIGTDFFARLPMFPSVPALLKLVLSYVDYYNICSSPLRGDGSNSEKHKKVWIKEHLRPLPKEIIITNNKPKWAKQPDGTPNILIDDRGLNINGWNQAGGIGIKYQADEDSLEIVKRGLEQAFASEDEQDDAKYERHELPQITKKILKAIPHTFETVDLSSIQPQQKERITENLQRQYKRIVENKYNPIVVDKDYRILNGHHRYEVLKQLNSQYIDVAKVPFTVEQVLATIKKVSNNKESIEEITRRDLLKGFGAATAGAVVGAKVDIAKAADAVGGKFDPNTLESGDTYYKVTIRSPHGRIVKYHRSDSYSDVKELEKEYEEILRQYNIGSHQLEVAKYRKR